MYASLTSSDIVVLGQPYQRWPAISLSPGCVANTVKQHTYTRNTGQPRRNTFTAYANSALSGAAVSLFIRSLCMEQIHTQPQGQNTLRMNPITQQLVVDGCKIKIRFKPKENKAQKEDVLECIRNTLLAASLSK